MHRPAPRSTLFPYTTLFRSQVRQQHVEPARDRRQSRALRPRGEGLRSEEHTSELQSPYDLVCRLLLEKKKNLLQSLCLLAPSCPALLLRLLARLTQTIRIRT